MVLRVQGEAGEAEDQSRRGTHFLLFSPAFALRDANFTRNGIQTSRALPRAARDASFPLTEFKDPLAGDYGTVALTLWSNCDKYGKILACRFRYALITIRLQSNGKGAGEMEEEISPG